MHAFITQETMINCWRKSELSIINNKKDSMLRIYSERNRYILAKSTLIIGYELEEYALIIIKKSGEGLKLKNFPRVS